jgi:DNA-binding GntR family transcriptional regulator
VSEAAYRSERELSDQDCARLEAAHRELREAVAGYERFAGGSLEAGQPVPVHDANEMRSAQEAVEASEDHLWQLREELLGWVRPPWAPSAALTSDWFSDEDAVYDDLPETTAS